MESATNNVHRVSRKLKEWCTDNHAILNTEKTNILYSSNMTTKIVCPANNQLEQRVIQVSLNTNLLGISIDQNLSLHCEALISRLNSVICTLKALINQIDEDTLKTVYCANFKLILSYRIAFWKRSSHSERVFNTQKVTLRVIFRIGYRDFCRDAFRDLHFRTFYISNAGIFHKNTCYFEEYRNVDANNRTKTMII